MAEKRLIANVGGIAKWHASEDGKHFVGQAQDGDAIKRSVREKADYFNSLQSKRDNPNGWQFAGSYSLVDLIGWCQDNGYTPDEVARDKGIKRQFAQWLYRERRAFCNEVVTDKLKDKARPNQKIITEAPASGKLR